MRLRVIALLGLHWSCEVDGKLLLVIRHGTSEHNLRYNRRFQVFHDLIKQRLGEEKSYDRWLFPEIEEWAFMTGETLDTSLVEAGRQEAQDLGQAWAAGRAVLYDRPGPTEQRVPWAMQDVELVVTSPLTRTLQTATAVFFNKGGKTPRCGNLRMLALDLMKEWSQGRHTPNLRKKRSQLAAQYPHVDFSALTEEDQTWQAMWPGEQSGLEPRSHLEMRVAHFREWIQKRPEKRIVVVGHGTFLGSLLYGSFIEDNEIEHGKVYACLLD